MVGTKKMPSIGGEAATSYPCPDAGEVGEADTSLGTTAHNWNLVNYVQDPPVLNESPATQKSYSWNRGEAGNANGGGNGRGNGNGNGSRY